MQAGGSGAPDARALSALSARLASAGFVAATEEAAELLASASGEELEQRVARRLTGEPLAWIIGTTVFCGLTIRIDPGVYVPRWHTEALVRRAGQRLPMRGVALDICTGSGAVARAMATRRPQARVVGGDLDERAVACARANDVEAYRADLFRGLPRDLVGAADVVVGVVPYVPTAALAFLQRDTFTFEAPLAYDGGADGTDLLRRVADDGRRFLRAGGALLLELGGDQADTLVPLLHELGYTAVVQLVDEDGDVRGIEATLGRPADRGRGGSERDAAGRHRPP